MDREEVEIIYLISLLECNYVIIEQGTLKLLSKRQGWQGGEGEKWWLRKVKEFNYLPTPHPYLHPTLTPQNIQFG